MGKTQIRDLAAEFGIGSKQLIRWLATMNIRVPGQQSALDDGQVALARTRWEREKRRGGERDGKQASPRAKRAQRKKATRRDPPRSQWTIPIAIEHRNTLADLIDHEIRERYKGITKLAWESTEQVIEDYCCRHGEPRFAILSRPQLHRLRYGQRPSIGEAAVGWLMFIIPDPDALCQAMLSPEARELLRCADSFYERRRLARSREREEARLKVLQAMRTSSPEAFEKFDQVVRGKGHSKETAELALDRVVEPFVLVPESGYVDREWDELAAEEQQHYVRWALGREAILLNRDHDLRRVQRRGFNRFLAALGEPHTQARRRLLRRRSSPPHAKKGPA